jgi:hypothetical protein
MPYLHWETDRGRTRSSNTIKEASKIMFSSIGEVVEKATANNEANSRPNRSSAPPYMQSQQSAQPMEEYPTSGRRKGILGQVLFHAAKLLEALDFSIEEKLFYEYLHQQPPLHPRRTLDASHYGALKNTETRDRDQVVYRATSPTAHICEQDPNHTDRPFCKQCHDHIRMVPRLIMVDQLWLWILDDSM